MRVKAINIRVRSYEEICKLLDSLNKTLKFKTGSGEVVGKFTGICGISEDVYEVQLEI